MSSINVYKMSTISLFPCVNFSLIQSSLFCNILTKHDEQFSENTSEPSIHYVDKGTGWVGSENWYFLLTFSTISADIGWVGWIEKVFKCTEVI